MEDPIECGEFTFLRDFDSGNLAHVDQIPKEEIAPGVHFKTNAIEIPDYEFNVWTRPDCVGTEFENGNRTWFYFGIKSALPSVIVKLNLVNLNRQGKMYSQGMAPVTKTVPGRPQWERIKDKPEYFSDENIFTLSFKFRTPDNVLATTYFAFTYPFTYVELQKELTAIDTRLAASETGNDDEIYYCRECVCYSLERRRIDLLTITSRHGITNQREERLKNLFPDENERPHKFLNKKVIFVSARVHPGETPSSFVFNGFLNLLLNRHDPVAIALRRMYVFKLIPFMNPDGVAKGHYRTDTRGVNLNRVYQTPSFELHPSVYAARSLIRYHHFGFEKYDNAYDTIAEQSFNSYEFPPIGCAARKPREYLKPDQENVTSSELNMKNKNTGKRDRWQSTPDQRYPSKTTQISSSNSHIPKMKLAIDSEDDTSCSMSTNNTTLVEQVEDLNINQSSVDGFNIIPSDTECAIDNLINKNNTSLVSTTLESEDLSIDANCNYDDDDDVVQSPNSLRRIKNAIKENITLSLANQPETSNKCNEDESPPISMSACFRLNQAWCNGCKSSVSELESRMPGISQMLPTIYKNEDFVNKNENTNEAMQCINCRLIITQEPKANSPNPQNLLTVNNNISVISESASSNTENINLPSCKDVNKNSLKSKDNNGKSPRKKSKSFSIYGRSIQKDKESGLFLYIDLHGHASKKGIFMYGNHFEEIESSVECMLLPRIMSLNNMHFHFSSCNFTERNMYLKDRRDGMSREGSGRVAVLKATGLMRSYTLECNYNTGRIVNLLPPTIRESIPPGPPTVSAPATPPKYTPHLFEEVGKSLGTSILDLTGNHPNSRIPASEHRNIHGIRDWLRLHSRHLKPAQVIAARQSTSACTPRTGPPRSVRTHIRTSKQQTFVDPERKENLVTPGYQVESRIASSRIGISSSSRTSSAALKLLPIRMRGDQPLSSKSQRNLSLISIKKPTISKHPPAFKPPLRNRSPGPKLRFNAKQKINEETDLVKGTIRSLMESNVSNPAKPQSFKTKVLKANFKGHKEAPTAQKQSTEIASTSLAHRKAKIRSKDSLYQKQPAAKPLTKRLKISQYIKYSDNAKEKYRIRKPNSSKNVPVVEPPSSSVSSSGEDMVISWDPLCGQNLPAGSSGVNTQPTAKCPQRPSFKPRRPALHHIPPAASDLTNIRHKFV